MPAIGSSISLHAQKMRRFCFEDGLVLAVIGRCAHVDRLGADGGRIQTGKANLTFDNFEGQDEISLEASAFPQEEVELSKPSSYAHVRETSH